VLAKLVVAALAALLSSVIGFVIMAAADDATDDISVMRPSQLAEPSSAMVNEPLTGGGLAAASEKIQVLRAAATGDNGVFDREE
jgi:hypothetical protein